MKDRLYTRAARIGAKSREVGAKVRSVDVSKVTRYAVALCFMAALSATAAHAQGTTGGTYGLGTDGGPVGSDYLASGSGFASNIGPILKSTLPLLMAMLAVWQGPRIIKMLVKKFSS